MLGTLSSEGTTRIARGSLPSVLWGRGLCLPALKGSRCGPYALLVSWRSSKIHLGSGEYTLRAKTVSGFLTGWKT
jgi:hypothetical protein